jgi:hypothetical protein
MIPQMMFTWEETRGVMHGLGNLLEEALIIGSGPDPRASTRQCCVEGDGWSVDFHRMEANEALEEDK